jgi:hypothetical protein
MLVSAELRWFWKDTLPPTLELWFRTGGLAPGGGSLRKDEYLADPRQHEIGVKKRAGNSGIEIKGLVEVGAAAPEPFSGCVQIWTKWTSRAMTIDHLSRIAVRKTRWLRKFDTSGPEVRELALDADERLLDSTQTIPEHGCHIELVSVTIDGGAQWWTFGFEAFGRLGTVERSLQRTIASVAPIDREALAGGLELSYPAWLIAVTSQPRWF